MWYDTRNPKLDMKQLTAPLPVKDRIAAYDYSGSLDSIFVATNDSVTVYEIDEIRKPRNILKFDHFYDISLIRAQHSNTPLVATIDSSVVNIWDIDKNSKPLVDIASFKSKVQDLRWYRHSPTCFMMATADGIISTWDTRSGSKCINQFSIGHRLCQSLKLSPTNNNLGALLADGKYIAIWDSRMLNNQLKSGIASDKVHDFYQVIEAEEDIADFHWHWCQPSIWTVTSKGKVDLMKVESSGMQLTQNRENVEKRGIGNPLALCWAVNPHPDGNGVIIQQKDVTKNVSTINYISFKNGASEEYEIAKSSHRLFVCKWRGSTVNPTSLLTVSESAVFHLFDWKRASSSEQASSAASTNGGTTKSKSKFNWDDVKLTIGFDDAFEQKDLITNNNSTTNKDQDMKGRSVVGPKTFALLMNEEIAVLDRARKMGKIDGIRVDNLDHFQRQLVLELLIPATDPFSLATKKISYYMNNYYKMDELRRFYKHGANKQTVALILMFNHKMQKIWQPKYIIENRSKFEFDMVTLTKIVSDGLEEVIKYHTEKAIVDTNEQQLQFEIVQAHGSLNKTTTSPNETATFTPTPTNFIYQLAKSFRKRVLRIWNKQTDNEQTIRRTSHTYSASSLVPLSAADKAPRSDSENDINPVTTSTKDDDETNLNKTNNEEDYCDFSNFSLEEPSAKLALRTPFPVLSKGIFNSRGELVLLGNAEIMYNGMIQKADCIHVSSIPNKVYNPSYAQKRTPAEARFAYRQPHMSHANLLLYLHNKMKSTASENRLFATISSNPALDSNPKLSRLHGSTSATMNTTMSTSRARLTAAGGGGDDDYQLTYEDSITISPADGLDHSHHHHNHLPATATTTAGITTRQSLPQQPTSQHGSYSSFYSHDDLHSFDDSNHSFDYHINSTSHHGLPHASTSYHPQQPYQHYPLHSKHRTHSFMSESSLTSSYYHQHHYNHITNAASTQLPSHFIPPYPTINNTTATTGAYSHSLPHHTMPISSPPIVYGHIRILTDFPTVDMLLAHELHLGPMNNNPLLDVTTTTATTPSPHHTQHHTTTSHTQNDELLQSRILACRQNSDIIQSYFPTHYGLIQCWNLFAVTLEVYAVIDHGGLISWNNSILGKTLFHQLMQYMIQIQNVQLLATLICIIGDARSMVRLWSTPSIPFITHDDDNLEDTMEITVLYCNQILYNYINMLRKWGELTKATEVAKHITMKGMIEKQNKYDISSIRNNSTFCLAITCTRCGQTIDQPAQKTLHTSSSIISNDHNNSSSQQHLKLRCANCSAAPIIYCSICTFPVKRMIHICDRCGHGGHEDHLSQWFNKYDCCPTGCGCKCRSLPTISAEELIIFDDDDENDDQDHPNTFDNTMEDNDVSIYPVNNKKAYHGDIQINAHYFEQILGNNYMSEYNYNNFIE